LLTSAANSAPEQGCSVAHLGSNLFWYPRDPAGNFSEYYSDLDCIVDDALWTPRTFEGMRALYNWGPPPPPSFLAPEGLAALVTGARTALIGHFCQTWADAVSSEAHRIPTKTPPSFSRQRGRTDSRPFEVTAVPNEGTNLPQC
jgi:hypothetical protein